MRAEVAAQEFLSFVTFWYAREGQDVKRLAKGLWQVQIGGTARGASCFVIDLDIFRPSLGHSNTQGVGMVDCNFSP